MSAPPALHRTRTESGEGSVVSDSGNTSTVSTSVMDPQPVTADSPTRSRSPLADDTISSDMYNPKDVNTTQDQKGRSDVHIVDVPAAPRGPSSPVDPISAGQGGPTGKLLYLEGIRGLAAWFVANGHFVDNTFRKSHPEVWGQGKPWGILSGGGWSVILFFILSGRVITASFLRSRNNNLKNKGRHNLNEPKTIPKWQSLASTMFRRPIRLGIPIAVAAFIQWQSCMTDATDIWGDAGKVIGVEAGRTDGWCSIGDFKGFLVFLLSCFSYGDPDYVLRKGSTIWSIPFEFWGSYYVYILSAVVILMGRARWGLYVLLLLILWSTYSFNLLFVFGLALADFDASGGFRRIRALKFPILLFIQCAVVACALTALWYGPAFNEMDYKVAAKQVDKGKIGADLDTFYGLRVSAWLSALLLLVWIELSTIGQWFFMTLPFRFMGK
ncbi:hypothetical protein HK104_000951, partial [Borealophlyctis nickersoniae]